MTNNVKDKLYTMCCETVQNRIDVIKDALSAAQESANNETKSTAGDKHDTSRAMMQLEVEQKSKQLAEAEKLKTALAQFNGGTNNTSAQLGSLVFTDAGNYYISVSVGKLDIKDDMFFAVSPVSPIASQMIGKKEGEKFNFNGRNITISEIR